MAQLTAKDITNLYLYGQKLTPANLVDNSLIRPDSATSSVNVNVQDFMATGAGRFAIGSQFSIITKFFDPSFFTPSVPPGTYTKQEIANIFGESFFGWSMQQYDFQDSTDDYAERVYIYNSQAFQISDDARFIVTSSGEKRIENFAIEPLATFQENFDFDTSDFITGIANSYLEARVDPSRIGRIVDINFVGSVPRATYDETSFTNDVIKRDSFGGFAPIKLFNDVNQLIDGLLNDGVTKFLDGNKPILYGTPGDDLPLTAANVNGLDYPTLNPYKDNGVVLIGGTGEDNIIGASKNDKLLGGQGADWLRSNDGLDTLDGGEGNDNLDGGEGEDVSIYSDAVENYDFSISDDGETVTITHAKGTQADGTDTLTNVEFGQFSEQKVQLLGNTLNFVNDFVVGTTQDTQVIFELTREGDTSFPLTVFVDGEVTTGNAVFNDFSFTFEAGANPNLIITASVSEVFGDVAFEIEISIQDNNPLSGLILIEDNNALGLLIGDQVDDQGGVTLGDPHLITFDNLAYDFQASGDFVLARATDGAQYEVQTRFVALSSAVSVTEAMATSVDGIAISLEADGNEGSVL
jgi:RTX calcium-binding nonapeptide repeat (4 copies)